VSANTVILNNTTPTTVSVNVGNFPPHVPLDLTSLVTLITGLTAQSTEPTSPSERDVYFDDGTNTGSGVPGLRWYSSGAWVDISSTGPIRSTPTSGQYRVTDLRMSSDLELIVEYDDVPEV